MQSRWSAIFIGTIVGVSFEMLFLLLGVGIGLFSIPFETGSMSWKGVGIGSGLYLLVSLFAAYFIGGFIAARLYSTDRRDETCFQGLAVWGTACCAMTLMVAFAALGLVESGVELIGEVADVETVVSAAGEVVAEQAEIVPKASTIRQAMASGGLLAFVGMLVASIGATIGAWAGQTGIAQAQRTIVRPRAA